MDRTSPERGSQPQSAAAQARTFTRRIDCAEQARAAVAFAPARGGGMRDPGRREPRGAHDAE